MSCNSCAKPFTLLRKEVCSKCRWPANSNDQKNEIVPPDAYYKRVAAIKCDSTSKSDPIAMAAPSDKDEEIANRLRKLKNDKKHLPEEEIAAKLQKLKGETPKTSDAELIERLAKLRGVPLSTVQSQPVMIKPDLRTEQEQADDLMKQYLEQIKVDTKYKDEFEGLVGDMESRLGKLKGAEESGTSSKPTEVESENEEDTIMKIIEKAKATATLEDDDSELPQSRNEELPFCEICNEDAKMRCLGCQYLFCKRCFVDHKDDDDGCNRYVPYNPPKSTE